VSSEGGPKFNQRVASVRLPLPLPDLFVSTDGVRSGVQAAPVEVDPRFQVRAVDAAYARTALSAGLLDAIAAFGQLDSGSTSVSTASSWLRSVRPRIQMSCRRTSIA
jgi:hypothetical protein